MNITGKSGMLRYISSDDVLRKKFMYRAKQRGFLELDLMLGKFATESLHSMSHDKLIEFGKIVDKETPDIFQQIIGQKDVEDDLKDNSVFQEIIEYWKTKAYIVN